MRAVRVVGVLCLFIIINQAKLRELTGVYKQIIVRLNDFVEAGIINEYVKGTVIAMSKKVLDVLTVKYSRVQEGVGKIMGGKILDYEANGFYIEKGDFKRDETFRN